MRRAQDHWDAVHRTRPPDEVSWFQARPETSLRLLSSVAPPSSAVIDVGAGTSTLVDALTAEGWSDVTVLDVSRSALEVVRARLRARRPAVSSVAADVLSWRAERSYGVWHDRAVLHFLVDPADRERYVAAVLRAVTGPPGVVIVGVFAADGPTECSGLPTARFTAAGLADTFAPAFRLTHSEREEHRTPGGVVQPFIWAVLHRVDGRDPA